MADAKRGKMHASASQLALVLLLIGWKGGANLLSKSHRVESAKPITFPHSNENRSIVQNHLNLALLNVFYKITKIVRTLWLAERSVCMRVCKHGCGVKLFGFSRANHASTNLTKFSSSKLKKFTLFTHFLVGWNLENRSKEGVYIFLHLSWPF